MLGASSREGFLMGLETIVFAGLTAFKAISGISAANKQAKQVTRQGEIDAKATIDAGNLQSREKALQIKRNAARQTSSFLQSGIELGDTAGLAINDIFATGIDDVNQIGVNANTRANNYISNANAQSKQLISDARTAAIGDIASGSAGSSFGDFGMDFTVPFTGSSTTFSAGGAPIPGVKPTRISF
jgi:vacuolar-type H+-ATPase subunit H